MKPTPSPEQALRVLEILGEWTAQGFRYSAFTNLIGHTQSGPQTGTTQIKFTNPEDWTDLFATGVNHFDALCQATTVMQILLEEHPAPDPEPKRLRELEADTLMRSMLDAAPEGSLMALHLSTLYSAADPDGRRLEFHCYAAPYYHDVVVPFDATHEGWTRRGGRPICPEHRLPGDEPYQEDP